MVALNQHLNEIASNLSVLSTSSVEQKLENARSLARRGYYADAESVLQNFHPENKGQETEAYHLLARMYAQQGRMDQALVYWKHILKSDPGNPEAIAGIAEVDRLSASGRTYGSLFFNMATITVIFALFIGVILYAEGKYQAISQDIGLIRSDVEIMGDRVIHATLSSDEKINGSLKSEISSIETSLKNLGKATRQDSETLNNEFAELLKQVQTNWKVLSTQETSINRLNLGLAEITTAISEINAITTETQNELIAFQLDTVTPLSLQIEEINTAVTETNRKITDAHEKIMLDQADWFEYLNLRISKLETRMSEMADSWALHSTVLEKRLNELSNKSDKVFNKIHGNQNNVPSDQMDDSEDTGSTNNLKL